MSFAAIENATLIYMSLNSLTGHCFPFSILPARQTEIAVGLGWFRTRPVTTCHSMSHAAWSTCIIYEIIMGLSSP
jgi:hypothetical protein